MGWFAVQTSCCPNKGQGPIKDVADSHEFSAWPSCETRRTNTLDQTLAHPASRLSGCC